ncbi:MAG: hypothetical protein SPH68_00030 [Candidatus Borkfalkiaceae bacterium]|nr:hypothetical protein [Clostridia bacterium]MDY6222535.1 hypothetical protein [Christensenellaceae bacterium]
MKPIKETGLYKLIFKNDGMISVCATAAFAVYNAWLGITRRYYFALSIAGYYSLLFAAGILLYFCIKREAAEKREKAPRHTVKSGRKRGTGEKRIFRPDIIEISRAFCARERVI